MKIVLEPNQKLWIFSDPHYNHKNMCQGVTEWTEGVRDFQTLDQYNDTLVNNLNSVIGQDDIAICMGDWAFGGFSNIWEFRKRINCKNIILFLGNHDEHIEKNTVIPVSYQDYCDNFGRFQMHCDTQPQGAAAVYAQDLFTSIHRYEQVQVKIPKHDGSFLKYNFIGFHFPIASWETMGRGTPHLFGHCHLPDNEKHMVGRSQDVGLDGNGLMPYEFTSLMRELYKKEIKSMMKFDHHIQSGHPQA